MFRKQEYEAAINLYHKVLEKAPGSCLPAACPPRWPGQFPPPARAALPRRVGPLPSFLTGPRKPLPLQLFPERQETDKAPMERAGPSRVPGAGSGPQAGQCWALGPGQPVCPQNPGSGDPPQSPSEATAPWKWLRNSPLVCSSMASHYRVDPSPASGWRRRQTQQAAAVCPEARRIRAVRRVGPGARMSRSESWSSTYQLCDPWQISSLLLCLTSSSVKWEQ